MRPFIKLVNSDSIFYTSYSRLCVSDCHLAEKYSKANVMCIYVIEDFCSYFSVSLSLIHFPGLTLRGSLNDMPEDDYFKKKNSYYHYQHKME